MKKKSLFLGIVLLSAFGLSSCSHTPEITIGENGNWFVDGVDQGVQAQGEKGDKGDKGDNGDNGVSIISISKTKSTNNVDTYTITYSNNTTSTFTVTNGEDGENADALTITNVTLKSTSNNVDTYEIAFSDGYKSTFTVTNGIDGETISVTSIELEKTEGLYDTYKINFSDNSSKSFIVKNGGDGKTPYIGENGNWWIGDVDTGVIADYDKANNVPLTIYSSGLKYETRTINGVSGYVVTGWELLDDEYLIATYGEELANSFAHREDKTLVIPNYIGSVPVIGVMSNSQLDFGKVVLSKNIIYLDQAVFKNCSKLKEIDFNGCQINEIPVECFYGTSLTSIDIPETVNYICDKAFDGVQLDTIDLKNVKYIGSGAFDDSFIDYIYLTDKLEYVGNSVFDCTFVYVEAESKPTNWGSISSSAYDIVYNVKKNNEYLYSIDNNEATIYQYLGNEKKLVIPATIDNIPITTIGCGFNSYIYDNAVFTETKASEIYRELRKNEGYINELIIGNNVKKIDKFALMNGSMFIYIEDSVEEIYISNSDGMIGCFIHADEDVTPFSLIVLEDSSKTKFNYNNTLKTYDELLAIDDDFEWLFKANIDYEDIYCDDNSIYYNKISNGYEVLSCRESYVDEIVILDSINNMQVKSIGKWAFVWNVFNKLTIGNNVNKIKPNAFVDCYGSIFIPNNVEIINANALDLNSSSSIIYVEVSQKPDNWDTTWNPNNRTVIYSTSKQTFANMFITDDYIGTIKSDNTIELLQYKGSYGTIKIPRTINGRTVTSIASDCFKTTSNYSNLKIYIPSSITKIASKGIVLYQSYYNAYIYLESNSIPSNYEENWYYNSYNNNTSYISVQTGTNFDY